MANNTLRTTKLFIIRQCKAIFLWCRLHVIFNPLAGAFTYLAYLAKFSKWRMSNRQLGFNDFYNGNVKYEDRFQLHEFVASSEKLEAINYIEFGVGKGVAIKWWVKRNIHPESQFVGFDVFTGLPDDFGVLKKGHFSTGGILPDTNDERCTYEKGLFQDSLPPFVKGFDFASRRNVIHMDADLYSSTLFVLSTLQPFLKPNDIIMFDEFGVPTHEFKAFDDFCQAYRFKYEVIGAVNNYLQIAIRVL
jgi:O-methyltransferase